MKKLLLLSAILPLAFACQTNTTPKKTYTITGTVKNMPDSTKIWMTSDNKPIDSTFVLNNQFVFEGSLENPIPVFLHARGTTPDYKGFWIENSNITFTSEGGLKDGVISGSKTQEIDNQLEERLKPLRKKRDSMNNYAAQNQQSMSQEEIKSFIAYINQLRVDELKETKKFIEANPNTLVSANLLNIYNTTFDKKEVVRLFDLMNEETKNTVYGKNIAHFIKISKELKVGDDYIDFTLNNTKDQAVTLSSVKKKYTLIEFWASWCGPCRQENPSLVETYKKYKPKGFEILGVSVDQSKKNWLNAVEKDGLIWENVIDPKADDGDVPLMYGVSGIPDNFLIDEEGNIIARNLRRKDLSDKLESLLK